LGGSASISPASIICFEGPSPVAEPRHVEISAHIVKGLFPVIPHFLGPHVVGVVSSEFPYFSFEPLIRVQEKSTIAITVELHTFINVVKLKESSPPSDDQVSRWGVVSTHAWVVTFRCVPILAPRVEVRRALVWVNCGSFPSTFP